MRTVIIIDDHEMMRAGLTASLKPKWQIAGEAGSIEEAKIIFSDLKVMPDLIILDIKLGDEWGLNLINILRRICSAERKKLPPILIYSVYDDYAHVNAALRAGVKGYICKSMSINVLLEAMEAIVSGKGSFPNSIVQRLTSVSDLLMGLSKREQEIFKMVQRGNKNKDIASNLGVSVRTIENNLSIIYDKIGVKNRKELVKL